MPTSEEAYAELVSTPECKLSTRVDGQANARMHLFMAIACSSLFTISVLGFWLTRMPGFPDFVALIVLAAASFIPALLWHDRRQYERRDAALTLPWTVMLVFLIPYVVVLSARLRFPLRDATFENIDHALGFSVPAIMARTSQDWIRRLMQQSYHSLSFLLPIAALVPALAGRKKAAQEFLLSNAIAFLIAFPLFAFLPAVGPWVGYHFPATLAQSACERSIIALHGSTDVADVAQIGIVCFPSFHAIWALLSAFGLRSFRLLRWPAIITSALIVLSTITTGWHYVCDVLVGIMVAAVAQWAASVSTH